jgi:TonB family protein
VVVKKLDSKQKELAFKRADELLNQMSDAMLKEKLTPVLLADIDCQFQLNPSKMVAPEYPQQMLNEGKTGSVDVDYTVDKFGFVRDYSIIAGTEAGFNEATLKAIKKWRYEPTLVNGAPVEVVVKQVRVKYRINGQRWDQEKIQAYITELRTKAETGSVSDMYAFAYVTDLVPELHVQKQESNSWYIKAAQAGLPKAQYEIGKSLFRGEGCRTDVKKGIEWLTLAAQDNSPEAQYFLGVSLLGSDQFQQNKKQAIEWLNHAAAGKHAKAAMRLSWILSTDEDESYRDAKKALVLVKEIYESYSDKLRATENLAAAQAANGLYDDAVKSQNLAIDSAKKINYPLAGLNKRLSAYEHHQPWREKI